MIFKSKKSRIYFLAFCALAFVAIAVISYLDRGKFFLFHTGYIIIVLHYLADLCYSLKYPLLEIKEDEIVQYELFAKRTIKIENLVSIKFLAGDYAFEDKSGQKIRIDKSRFNKSEIAGLEQKINELEELLEPSTDNLLVQS